MKKLLQLLLSSAIFAFSTIASGADRNCQLVSASEANAAFGANMSAGVPAKSNDGKPDCEYRAPLPDETMLIAVAIDKNARSLFASEKSSLARSRTSLGLATKRCCKSFRTAAAPYWFAAAIRLLPS